MQQFAPHCTIGCAQQIRWGPQLLPTRSTHTCRAFGKAFATSMAAAEPVQQQVPTSFSEATAVFLRHPSAWIPAAGILGTAGLRTLQQHPLTLADGAVGACVVAFWLIQEWVVHRWLLHSSWEWAGKTIHKEHHEQPYFHISLDPPGLIVGVMLLASGVFAALLGPHNPLWLTATASYWAAGLVYEWLHYIVHTRWVPPPGWRGQWLREVRRHHMLHHMRNEQYWLSFSAPQVDALFGTLPSTSSSVPLTDMARIAHGSAAAASKHESSSSSSSKVPEATAPRLATAGVSSSSMGAAGLSGSAAAVAAQSR